VSFIVGTGGEGLAALSAAFEPNCGCTYWTNSNTPAHADRCVPVRSPRLPVALALSVPSSLSDWISETPRPEGGVLGRWVAEAPASPAESTAGTGAAVEQIYAELSAAVRADDVRDVPLGFVDLGLSVALAVLADAEDAGPADVALAERVQATAQDLPHIVAAAIRHAVSVTAADAPAVPGAGHHELVAGVTAELGPKLMDQIDRAVETAVRYRLGGDR